MAFRKSDSNLRLIDLIDEHGNRTRKELHGNMDVIGHESILEALSNRANQFRNVGKTRSVDNHQVSYSLDETGTVDATLLKNFREEEEI